MAKTRSLSVVISGDSKDLSRALKGAGTDASALERKLKGASTGIGGAFRGISQHAKLAGAAIGVGLVYEAKRAIGAFEETRKVAAQTNAVLASTKGIANVSASEIANLATAISRKTGVDDEAIQSGENLLLTFTNLRNETGKGNDIFTQATKVVTDMSVALGQDTKSSAIQVGKALNDPIKGITALQRVGVSFTADQKKQITTLEQTGHHLEAQKIILRELNTEFKGSAAAQATPLQKAKVAAGNLEEALGKGLAPVVDTVLTKFTNLATKVEPPLNKVTKSISKTFKRGDLDLGEKITISWAKIQRKLTPLGREFSKGITNAKLGAKLSDAIENAAPMIADAMAAAAPHAAGAFVRAFKEAGPWGKLITVAFLASKMGAFSSVGGWAAGKFTTSLKKRMGSTMPAAGAAGGAAYSGSFATASSTGIAAAGGKGGKMRNAATRAGRGLGSAMGIAAAALFAVELAKGVEATLKDKLPGGNKPHRPDGTPGAGWNLFDFIGSKIGKGAGDVVGSLDFGATLGGGSLGGMQTAGLQKEAKQGLSYISSHFGGVSVSSGWRSQKENAAVGGAPNSDHLKGLALDLVPSEGWTSSGTARLDRIAAWARKSPTIRWIGWRGVPGHGPGDHLHLSFMDRIAGDVAMGPGGRLKAYGGKRRGVGDVLGYDKLKSLWTRAGGPAGQADTAAAVALAESGGNSSIVNGIGATGLWQIHPAEPGSKDPLTNAKQAVRKFRESGWQPWEAYTGPDGKGSDGPWRGFLRTGSARSRSGSRRSAGSLDEQIATTVGGTPPRGGGVPARSGGSGGTDYGTGGYTQGVANVGVEKATATAHDSLPAMIKALGHEKTLKRRRLKKINRTLKRRIKRATRATLTDEKAQLITDLAEINGLLKEYRADAAGGATTITGADELTAGVPDAAAGGGGEAEAGPTPMDFANAAIAEAGLTPGLGDDIKATSAALDIATGDLAAARASGDPRRRSEAIGVWTSIHDSLVALKTSVDDTGQAMRDHTAALQDVHNELKRSNDIAHAIQSTDNFQLTKFLSDTLGGFVVGRGVVGRSFTPGTGVEHAY